MKLQVLSFISMLLLISCNGNKTMNCSRFKNGNFTTHNNDGTTTIIKRLDSTQTEINLSTGMILRSKITWPDACSYLLSDLSYAVQDSMITDSLFNKKTFSVTILKENWDYYVCRSNLSGSSFFSTDTVWVMK